MYRLQNISFLKNIRFLFYLYLAVTIAASIHRYLLGLDHINNFIIFKSSFFNLIRYKDLYVPHPELHADLFKYSPSFAFFMGLFAYVPHLPGIVLWNVLNALMLFFAVKGLPHIHDYKKGFVLLFAFIELLTSLQNSQSNGLMAGLILFAFIFFERKNVFLAALCIALGFYIKVFGLAAAVLFLLYPNRLKFAAFLFLWGFVLFALPLFVISFEQLVFLYKSWFYLLGHDTAHVLNFSVMAFLKACFSIRVNDVYVQLAGLLLLLLPFLHKKFFGVFAFRLLLLSSLLVWVIIFNHKAESPTFVIAMLGVALWYVLQLPSTGSKFLVVLAFVLTSLSSTDLFPKFIKTGIIVPYALKALPCILIWLKIQYELNFFRKEKTAILSV